MLSGSARLKQASTTYPAPIDYLTVRLIIPPNIPVCRRMHRVYRKNHRTTFSGGTEPIHVRCRYGRGRERGRTRGLRVFEMKDKRALRELGADVMIIKVKYELSVIAPSVMT